MSERSRSNWVVATTMTAILLVPLLIVVAVVIGARGADPADTGAPPLSQAVPTAQNESPTKHEATAVAGDGLARMVQQHQAMMDQMRVSLSPTMTEQMNRDPMWQMMRSGAFIPLLQAHEDDIDRMLARDR